MLDSSADESWPASLQGPKPPKAETDSSDSSLRCGTSPALRWDSSPGTLSRQKSSCDMLQFGPFPEATAFPDECKELLPQLRDPELARTLSHELQYAEKLEVGHINGLDRQRQRPVRRIYVCIYACR